MDAKFLAKNEKGHGILKFYTSIQNGKEDILACNSVPACYNLFFSFLKMGLFQRAIPR